MSIVSILLLLSWSLSRFTTTSDQCRKGYGDDQHGSLLLAFSPPPKRSGIKCSSGAPSLSLRSLNSSLSLWWRSLCLSSARSSAPSSCASFKKDSHSGARETSPPSLTFIIPLDTSLLKGEASLMLLVLL